MGPPQYEVRQHRKSAFPMIHHSPPPSALSRSAGDNFTASQWHAVSIWGLPLALPNSAFSAFCFLTVSTSSCTLAPSSGPCDQALWTTDKGSLLKPTPGRNALVSEGWTGYSLSPQQASCLCPNLKSETVTSSVEEWEERSSGAREEKHQGLLHCKNSRPGAGH